MDRAWQGRPSPNGHLSRRAEENGWKTKGKGKGFQQNNGAARGRSRAGANRYQPLQERGSARAATPRRRGKSPLPAGSQKPAESQAAEDCTQDGDDGATSVGADSVEERKELSKQKAELVSRLKWLTRPPYATHDDIRPVVADCKKQIEILERRIEDAKPVYLRAARNAENVKKATNVCEATKRTYDQLKMKQEEATKKLKEASEAMAKAKEVREEAKRVMAATDPEGATPDGCPDPAGQTGQAGQGVRLTPETLAAFELLMATGSQQATDTLARCQKAFKLGKARAKAAAAADMPPPISTRTRKRGSEAASKADGSVVLALEDDVRSTETEPTGGTVAELVKRRKQRQQTGASESGSACGPDNSMRD